MYFAKFTSKMVNTCSDEIQALTERKIETKCIATLQSDRVLKKIVEVISTEIKEVIQKETEKTACIRPLCQFISSM